MRPLAGEIAIPAGHAGQTRDGLVLAHQVRTIDLRRLDLPAASDDAA